MLDETIGTILYDYMPTFALDPLDLIRFRGHFLKGGYDVHDGNRDPETTTATEIF